MVDQLLVVFHELSRSLSIESMGDCFNRRNHSAKLVGICLWASLERVYLPRQSPVEDFLLFVSIFVHGVVW